MSLLVAFDTSAVEAVLSEAVSLFAKAKAADCVPEAVDAFLSAVETGEEVLFVQADDGFAFSAGKCVIRLHPSDGLTRAVAALRACDV